jgi:chromate transporter
MKASIARLQGEDIVAVTTPGSTILTVRTITLRQLFLIFLKIGFTGFGPAYVAEAKKHFVQRSTWLSDEDFVNGLALAQLLPGATYVSFTVYIGYKLRGIAGAITCFFSFLLPPFSIMVLLSYLYFTYGSIPAVGILFKGMEVVVAGLVAHAVIEIGKTAVTDWPGVVIAALAVGIMLYSANIFVLLLAAAFAGILVYQRPLKDRRRISPPENARPNTAAAGTPGRRIIGFAAMFAVFLAATVYALAGKPVLLQLGWVFFRMGALLFGGGFSMIPFIQQEVVSHYQWLQFDEFAVGIALGQVTPGPILITATFVGYKVAAVSGAVMATLGIFLPSLFWVIATTEVHQKIRHNILVKSAIKGIAAAFAGMILLVAIGLIRHAFFNFSSIGVALLTFGTFRFSKLDTPWVLISGTILYWLISMYFVFTAVD